MRTSRTRLAQTVADTILKRGVSKRFSRELAAYLLSERRVRELDSLLRDVQADWAEAGHVEVIARSAHPLSDKAKKDINREIKRLYPKARKIVINEVADPDIVGGVRLQLSNQQLDLSIRTKLNKFKQLATTGKD